MIKFLSCFVSLLFLGSCVECCVGGVRLWVAQGVSFNANLSLVCVHVRSKQKQKRISTECNAYDHQSVRGSSNEHDYMTCFTFYVENNKPRYTLTLEMTSCDLGDDVIIGPSRAESYSIQIFGIDENGNSLETEQFYFSRFFPSFPDPFQPSFIFRK